MVALALLLLTLSSGPEPGDGYVERTVPLMGTMLRLEVRAAHRDQALEASERAIRALETAEGRLSTWDDTSELSEVNQTPPGHRSHLKPDLARELAVAQACWKATGGAFDPAIGAVLKAWDVRGHGRIPAESEVRAALANSGLQNLKMAEDRVSRALAGLVLDEGGFGKGAGLDRAAEALAAMEPPVQALLDLGGQLSAVGQGHLWGVGIAHPRDRNRTVLRLQLASGSIATSGNSERGLDIRGQRFSHVLDPRTGQPADDFGSLTVVTFDTDDSMTGGDQPDSEASLTTDVALWADCLSTGLYVLGPNEALAWAETRPGVEVLVLEATGTRLRARCTSGLEGRLTSLEEGLEVEVFSFPDQAFSVPINDPAASRILPENRPPESSR